MTDKTVGFIGTGGISSFVARGLCSAPEFTGKIILSVHKHREKAEALKCQFPERITICEDNQRIVEASDFVVIAVLPQQHEAVAGKLHFTENNRIIHFTGGVRLSSCEALYSEAFSAVRSIPLPFTARRSGPILFYGKDELSRELLSYLGSIVEVKSEDELSILGPVTGMMVPYYALLAEYIRWGEKHGLDFRTITDYCCYMNSALSDFMRTDCTEELEKFLLDNSTPGGVNELGLKLMREKNGYAPWTEVLDEVYSHYNKMSREKK